MARITLQLAEYLTRRWAAGDDVPFPVPHRTIPAFCDCGWTLSTMAEMASNLCYKCIKARNAVYALENEKTQPGAF